MQQSSGAADRQSPASNSIDQQQQRPRVRMYCTDYCPYCVRARRLLEGKGAAWEEIAVGGDRERFQEMTQLSNRVTVPQIFIGDVHVGGYDDMAALDRAGKLDPLLGLE